MKNVTKNQLFNNKNFRGKFFSNKLKITKLLNLAKTNSYSAIELAKIFSCNRKTILHTLYSQGVTIKNKGKFQRKYCVDDYFFSELNPCSAYWAGFIAADGNLYKTALSIGLNKRDLGHIIKFKKAIKFEGRIYNIKSNNSMRVQIHSNHIVRALGRLGIHPNKSLSISQIKVCEGFLPHFLRGVFDGDGSISGRDLSHLQFSIAGNKPFLEKIQMILIAKCGMRKTKIYPSSSKAFKLQYTGSQIFNFLDWIYACSDAEMRLSRKYVKYLHFKYFREMVMNKNKKK